MATGNDVQLARAVVDLEANTLKMRRDLAVAGRDLRNLEGTAKKTTSQLGTLTKVATTAGAGFLLFAGVQGVRAGWRSLIEFNQAMTESLSIMGNVSASMRTEMAESAKEMGVALNFSATQGAEAYFFLASAGLSAEQSLAALPTVAQFARAGMFDFATATDLATDAQSALGLTVDDSAHNLRNMTRVTDVLVKANALANATVEQFATALTTEAGAAMKSFGIDIEEGVAVLAAFADQGVKSQVAGTGLSRILRLMSSAAVTNADAMERLGIEVFDKTTGNLRNMADIVQDLEEALIPMSDEVRTAALENIGFAARVQGVILPLLGTSEAIREYEAELRLAAGTTKEISDKQMQSLENRLGSLTQEFANWRREQAENVVPVLLLMLENVDLLVDVLKAMTTLLAGAALVALGKYVAGVVAATVQLVNKNRVTLAEQALLLQSARAEITAANANLVHVSALGASSTALNAKAAAQTRVAAAHRTYAATTALSTTATGAFATSIKALFASMGPAGWLILGLTAAIPLLTKLMQSQREAAQAAEDHKEKIEGLHDSLMTLEASQVDIAVGLIQSQLWAASAAAADAAEKFNRLSGLGGLGAQAAGAQAELEMASGKVAELADLLAAAKARKDELLSAGDGDGAGSGGGGGEESTLLDRLAEAKEQITLWGEAFESGVLASYQELSELHDRMQHRAAALASIAADETRSLEERVRATQTLLDLEKERERVSRRRGTLRDVNSPSAGVTPPQFGNLDGQILLSLRRYKEATEQLAAEHEIEAIRVARTAEELAELEAARDAELAAISSAARAVASLAEAFGLVEGGAQEAVRGISDILSGFEAFQEAQKMGGAAGIIGQIGGAGAILGGAIGLVQGLIGNDDEERKKRDEERNRILEQNLEEIKRLRQTNQTPVTDIEDWLARAMRVQDFGGFQSAGVDYEKYREDMLALGEEFGIVMQDAEGNTLLGAVDQLVEALQLVVENVRRAEAALMDDLEVRNLYAKGLNDEADALRLRIEQERELAEARKKGFSDETLSALEATQALERAAIAREKEAEAARKAAELAAERARFETDLLAREASLSGNERHAQLIRLQAQAESELEAARKLLESGAITEEQLRRLAEVLKGEVSQAMEDFDQQLQDAAAAARDAADAEKLRQQTDLENLRIRLLVAQGLSEEATKLRNQLEILKAVEEGRSAEYIALLRQIQAEEAIARKRDEMRQGAKDLADAAGEANKAIDGMTRALNAPAGFPLALRRAAAIGVQGTRPDPSSSFTGVPAAGRSSSIIHQDNRTTQVEARIEIRQLPGEDSNALAKRVWREFENMARAGNAPVLTERG